MSDQVSPAQPPAVDQPSVRSPWVAAGWAFVFLFPLIGFAIGFFLPRKDGQQGLWIMAASVVVGLVYLSIRPG